MDADAGAISNPFFQLSMRSKDRERVYESESCKKNTETPATLCYILTPL